MISLPVTPTRATLFSGLLLLLLALLVLTLVVTQAHSGSAPILHSHLMIASNGSGGPGVP